MEDESASIINIHTFEEKDEFFSDFFPEFFQVDRNNINSQPVRDEISRIIPENLYYKAEGNNYNTKEGSVEAIINKADLSGNFVTAKILTYTGEAQELVRVSNQLPDDCTVKYSMDEESWSAQIPTAVDAGEYTIYYKTESDNYNTKTGSVEATVNKAVYEDCEVRKEYSCATNNSDSVSLQDLLPTDCGTVSYGTPVAAGDIESEIIPWDNC